MRSPNSQKVSFNLIIFFISNLPNSDVFKDLKVYIIKSFLYYSITSYNIFLSFFLLISNISWIINNNEKKIKELKYNDTTNMGRGVSIKDIFLKTFK